MVETAQLRGRAAAARTAHIYTRCAIVVSLLVTLTWLVIAALR
jgi:hypothetical protein